MSFENIDTLIELQRAANLAHLIERTQRSTSLKIQIGNQDPVIVKLPHAMPPAAKKLIDCYIPTMVVPVLAGAQAVSYLQEDLLPDLDAVVPWHALVEDDDETLFSDFLNQDETATTARTAIVSIKMALVDLENQQGDLIVSFLGV